MQQKEHCCIIWKQQFIVFKKTKFSDINEMRHFCE